MVDISNFSMKHMHKKIFYVGGWPCRFDIHGSRTAQLSHSYFNVQYVFNRQVQITHRPTYKNKENVKISEVLC
jgi:hypothetical protein